MRASTTAELLSVEMCAHCRAPRAHTRARRAADRGRHEDDAQSAVEEGGRGLGMDLRAAQQRRGGARLHRLLVR